MLTEGLLLVVSRGVAACSNVVVVKGYTATCKILAMFVAAGTLVELLQQKHCQQSKAKGQKRVIR